jgi:glutamyl-tRNA synthetase
VPLVLDSSGERLAKRHGVVTLDDQSAVGRTPQDVLALFAVSLGLADEGETVRAVDLIERFDPAALGRQPWVMPTWITAAQ